MKCVYELKKLRFDLCVLSYLDTFSCPSSCIPSQVPQELCEVSWGKELLQSGQFFFRGFWHNMHRSTILANCLALQGALYFTPPGYHPPYHPFIAYGAKSVSDVLFGLSAMQRRMFACQHFESQFRRVYRRFPLEVTTGGYQRLHGGSIK